MVHQWWDRGRGFAWRLAAGVTGRWQQLWFGAVCSAAAVAGRWAVDPWLGDRHEFLPGYLAIVAATWVASWRAGAIAAALFLAATSLLFGAGRSEADAELMHQVLAHASFVTVAALLAGLTHLGVRAHRALQQRVRELDAADHRKSDFIAMVAHELRNPLAMLTTGTALIREGRLPEHALDNAWQALERQTAAMKRLVGDLMDTARAEQGKLSLTSEPVEIAAFVLPAVADARAFVETKGQRVAVTLPAAAGRVQADAQRMQQVLENLLHNASKFSPKAPSSS